MKIDTTKHTREEIEAKPGLLPAQIVYNTLIKNEFKIWLISHINGMLFYNMGLGPNHFATVVFTTKEQAVAYLNFSEVKNAVLHNFGKKIILVNTNLIFLYKTVTQHNHMFLSTVSVNPLVGGHFHIPISLEVISDFVDKSIIDIEYDEDDYDISRFEYNSKIKKFEEVNEVIDLD